MTALMTLGCDPLAARLQARQLALSYAATGPMTFDTAGNLILTSQNEPHVVRLDRKTEQLEDISQGFPRDLAAVPIVADGNNTLYAGGHFRRSADTAWRQLPVAPVITTEGRNKGKPYTLRHSTVDPAGTVTAIMDDYVDGFHDLAGPPQRVVCRLAPDASSWSLSGTVSESASLVARADGTVFFSHGMVLSPEANELKPIVRCPTDRLEPGCPAKPSVVVHHKSNETLLVTIAPIDGQSTLFRVPPGATFPVDFDALQPIPLSRSAWEQNRMTSDGVLHIVMKQAVTLDYPPYSATEGVIHALDPGAGELRRVARMLWPESGQVLIGEFRDIYKASAQLQSGGIWFADPVYKWLY